MRLAPILGILMLPQGRNHFDQVETWGTQPGITICPGTLDALGPEAVWAAIIRTELLGATWKYTRTGTCHDAAGYGEVQLWAGDLHLTTASGAEVVGITSQRFLLDGSLFSVTVVVEPDEYLYVSRVIEHELGHARGLNHICEVPNGFGSMPDTYRMCRPGDEDHLMHPAPRITEKGLRTDGMRDGFRKAERQTERLDARRRRAWSWLLD